MVEHRQRIDWHLNIKANGHVIPFVSQFQMILSFHIHVHRCSFAYLWYVSYVWYEPDNKKKKSRLFDSCDFIVVESFETHIDDAIDLLFFFFFSSLARSNNFLFSTFIKKQNKTKNINFFIYSQKVKFLGTTQKINQSFDDEKWRKRKRGISTYSHSFLLFSLKKKISIY